MIFAVLMFAHHRAFEALDILTNVSPVECVIPNHDDLLKEKPHKACTAGWRCIHVCLVMESLNNGQEGILVFFSLRKKVLFGEE